MNNDIAFILNKDLKENFITLTILQVFTSLWWHLIVCQHHYPHYHFPKYLVKRVLLKLWLMFGKISNLNPGRGNIFRLTNPYCLAQIMTISKFSVSRNYLLKLPVCLMMLQAQYPKQFFFSLFYILQIHKSVQKLR